MSRFATATIGLFALGFALAPDTAPAQDIAPAQPMDSEVEKLLTQPGRKPVVSFTLNEDGTIEPMYAAGTTVTESDKPWPSGATPLPFGPLIVHFYDKPGNTHCYSFWNGSKWTEVCPQH